MTTTAAPRVIRAKHDPLWLYQPDRLTWKPTASDNPADEFNPNPRPHVPTSTRTCPMCDTAHRQGTPCNNAEWTLGSTCQKCFLELPVSGVCGNCE